MSLPGRDFNQPNGQPMMQRLHTSFVMWVFALGAFAFGSSVAVAQTSEAIRFRSLFGDEREYGNSPDWRHDLTFSPWRAPPRGTADRFRTFYGDARDHANNWEVETSPVFSLWSGSAAVGTRFRSFFGDSREYGDRLEWRNYPVGATWRPYVAYPPYATTPYPACPPYVTTPCPPTTSPGGANPSLSLRAMSGGVQ